ncbi:universal stress protein [Flavobacterium sp. MAH-1]|uniref:Universal stress protein n=1 Tax=Flavobacterium agri TaxID=2743471 RepID=A0A7Y8Y4L8_9FLAO|nr:universal stress protein [Flavobacterium agri]NUY82327.1 universal stress protein [Flavobacterium agri]NYA72351.1 universal stress protein [Flavobacterium agri]
MKKILFPTDFSEAANNAFVYALHLAKHLDARIVTLHVYEMPVVDYIDVPAYLMEVYDTVELANFENYKSQIPILRNIASQNQCDEVQIDSVLLDGDLVNSILQLVKTDNIDFVVMGTKGATGATETFLGTSTADVMTRTDALVLAVPEKSRFMQIKKIAFTTRFREKDLPALKKLLPLAKAFGAQIDCLYIKTPSTDVKDVVVADWELLMKNENVRFHIVENQDVEHSILDFIDNQDIDLLALLNHKRGFFEGLFHKSMTKKLAFHCSVPILAIHD